MFKSCRLDPLMLSHCGNISRIFHNPHVWSHLKLSMEGAMDTRHMETKVLKESLNTEVGNTVERGFRQNKENRGEVYVKCLKTPSTGPSIGKIEDATLRFAKINEEE